MKKYLSKHKLILNGLAMRYRGGFENGELANADEEVSSRALKITKEACDVCRELGGEVVTIWQGFDGFDYSFQVSYAKAWRKIEDAITEVADYAPDIKISLEYKPYEERAYALLDSMGTTMLMMTEIDRDNVGITLDYCHMLMKHENPAYAADILGSRGKLFGVHLNDGYGRIDDGLMVGTASPLKTIEFLYYIKKYNSEEVIYFDTFPIIENAVDETIQNIEMIKLLDSKIDKIGMNKIQDVIDSNSGIKAAELMREFIK